ncbi:MAG: hypothetical protein ACE5FS_03445 [Paracoccaceae bacterium]
MTSPYLDKPIRTLAEAQRDAAVKALRQLERELTSGEYRPGMVSRVREAIKRCESKAARHSR